MAKFNDKEKKCATLTILIRQGIFLATYFNTHRKYFAKVYWKNPDNLIQKFPE